MPLLTASTPVIAVQPLANARNRSQMLAVSVASGNDAGGTSGGSECLVRSKPQNDREARDEQVSWHRQDPAGFLRAAQIDQRDHKQNAEAKPQDIGVQLGHGRDKRADAGRNADRDVEHIIDH
jgi:hypothetical protein